MNRFPADVARPLRVRSMEPRKSCSPEDEWSPKSPFIPATSASIVSTPMGAAMPTLSFGNEGRCPTGVCGGENEEGSIVDAE